MSVTGAALEAEQQRVRNDSYMPYDVYNNMRIIKRTYSA